MALQRQLWSINALSVELGIDRRTLAKRLQDLPPAQESPNVYRLRDVLDCLRQYQDNFPDFDAIPTDVVIETVITSLGNAFREQLPKTLRAAGRSDAKYIMQQTDAIMLAFSFLGFSLATQLGVVEGGLSQIAQLGREKHG